MISNQSELRQKSVALLIASIESEKRGDSLIKRGRPELAARAYAKCLNIEEKVLGKDHSLVEELRTKTTQKSGWQKTAQRKRMIALDKSFQHEKQGDYLRLNEKESLAIREFQYSLRIEEIALGKDHPVVAALRSKIPAIASEESDETSAMASVKSEEAVSPTEIKQTSSQLYTKPAIVLKMERNSAVAGSAPLEADKRTIISMAA